jgi:hypothetical protein
MSSHRIEATFARRTDAMEAVEHLLDAHVPPHRIEIVGPRAHRVPLEERNSIVRPALIGAVSGFVGAMILLAIGATQVIPLPVLAEIIDNVGIAGAGLRLAYLGVGVGVVSGALGGLTTWAKPAEQTASGQPHQVRVKAEKPREVTEALEDTNVVSLRVV